MLKTLPKTDSSKDWEKFYLVSYHYYDTEGIPLLEFIISLLNHPLFVKKDVLNPLFVKKDVLKKIAEANIEIVKKYFDTCPRLKNVLYLGDNETFYKKPPDPVEGVFVGFFKGYGSEKFYDLGENASEEAKSIFKEYLNDKNAYIGWYDNAFLVGDGNFFLCNYVGTDIYFVFCHMGLYDPFDIDWGVFFEELSLNIE
jgi:hypothetical protein